MKPYNDIKIRINNENDLNNVLKDFEIWWQNFWFQKGFKNKNDIKEWQIIEN